MKKILTIAITTAAIVGTVAVAYAAINRKAKEMRVPSTEISLDDHDIETVTE